MRRKLMGIVAMGMALAMGMSASAAEAELVIQAGHVEAESEESVHHVMWTKFAEQVSELSGGTMEIQILGSGQLGAERDTVEGMQLGTVEMASTANMVLGAFMPEFMVLDLPYMYADYETAYKVLDSEVMQEVYDKFAEECGVRILGVGQGGFRHTVTNKSITTLDDFSGVKIRVPESDIYIDTFAALGANPTPMAFSEVFTGIQQGTIDGFEIVAPVVLANSYYEVCSNLSLTKHFFSPNPLMISESLYSSLTEEQQQILQQAAKNACVEERAWVEEKETQVLEALEEKGMTIDREVDLEAFQDAVSGLYDKYSGQIGEDLVSAVQELCAE